MATVEPGRRRVGPRARRRRQRWASRPPSSTTTRTCPTWPTPRGGAGSPPTGSPTGYAGSALALAAALPFALAGSYGGAFLTAAALFGLFALPAMLFLPAGPARRPLRSARRSGSASPRRGRPLRRILRPPEPPRLPPRLPLLRGRHQHRRVLLVGVRGPHARLHDRRGDRPLLRRPDLGPGRGLALGAADRHLGAEDRRDDRPLSSGASSCWPRTSSTTKGQFYVVAIFAGTGLGAVQAAARAFMASLIPKGQEAVALRLLLALRQDRRGDGPGDLRHGLAAHRREPAGRRSSRSA